MRVSAELR